MPDAPSSAAEPILKEQKIGVILLSIFGIFALALGGLKIRNNLYRPFALSNAVPITLKDEVNSPEAWRWRDTDFDGLNDFDELYVYGTSQYLADSDSDGLADGLEVAKGTNPLCPEEKDCSQFSAGASPASGVGAADVLLPNPEALGSVPDLNKIVSDPAELRRLLREAGVEENILQSVTDKDLLFLVRQMLATTTLPGLPASGKALPKP